MQEKQLVAKPAALPKLGTRHHQGNPLSDKVVSVSFAPAFLILRDDDGSVAATFGSSSLAGGSWLRMQFSNVTMAPGIKFQLRQHHFDGEADRPRRDANAGFQQTRWGYDALAFSQEHMQTLFEFTLDQLLFPNGLTPSKLSEQDLAMARLHNWPTPDRRITGRRVVFRVKPGEHPSERFCQSIEAKFDEGSAQEVLTKLLRNTASYTFELWFHGGTPPVTKGGRTFLSHQQKNVDAFCNTIIPARYFGKIPNTTRDDWFPSRHPLYEEDGRRPFGQIMDILDMVFGLPEWLKDPDSEQIRPMYRTEAHSGIPVTHHPTMISWSRHYIQALLWDRDETIRQQGLVYNNDMSYPARFAMVNDETFRVSVKLKHPALRAGQYKIKPSVGTKIDVFVPELLPLDDDIAGAFHGTVCDKTREGYHLTVEVKLPEVLDVDKPIQEGRDYQVFVLWRGQDELTRRRLLAMENAVLLHQDKQAPPTEHAHQADRGSFWLPNIIGHEEGIWQSPDFLRAAKQDPKMSLACKTFALVMRANDAELHSLADAAKVNQQKVPQFNRQQKDFFEEVFHGQNSRSSVVLLEGFPGSGKTLTLAYATVGFMLLQRKVMVTAQPNRGVEALFDDMLSLFAEQPTLTDLRERAVHIHTARDEMLITEHLRRHGVAGGLHRLHDLKYAKYSLAYRIFQYCEAKPKGPQAIEYLDFVCARAEGKSLNSRKKWSDVLSQMQKIVLDTSLLAAGSTFVVSTLDNFKADVVILDEASMATEPDLVMAILPQRLSCRLLVLAGDDKQMSPVVTSDTATRNPLGNLLASSTFSRLLQGWPQLTRISLIKNYRGHPSTFAMANAIHYGSRMESGHGSSHWDTKTAKQINLMLRCPAFQAAFPHSSREQALSSQNRQLFLDVNTFPELEEDGTSQFNKGGILAILRLVGLLLAKGIDASRIGIITMYGADRRVMTRQLRLNNLPEVAIAEDAHLSASTVSSFQGGEKDIIIVHFVAASDTSGGKDPFGIAKEPRRLCVATTRAREYQFLVGNFTYWSQWRQQRAAGGNITSDSPAKTMVQVIDHVHQNKQVVNFDNVTPSTKLVWKDEE